MTALTTTQRATIFAELNRYRDEAPTLGIPADWVALFQHSILDGMQLIEDFPDLDDVYMLLGREINYTVMRWKREALTIVSSVLTSNC